MLFATISTQGDEDKYTIEALELTNLKIMYSCMFLVFKTPSEALRLLNWLLEVTIETNHLCLELSGAVDGILVIDLCFFDQFLNIEVTDENDAPLIKLTQQTCQWNQISSQSGKSSKLTLILLLLRIAVIWSATSCILITMHPDYAPHGIFIATIILAIIIEVCIRCKNTTKH